jgi:hypothetical protein
MKTVTRRFYNDSPIDMSNARRFASAYQKKQTVLIGDDCFEPYQYKVFPDSVEFLCYVQPTFDLNRSLQRYQ